MRRAAEGFDGSNLGAITRITIGINEVYGGETGIRTLDRVSPIHAFQACAFSHSAISPQWVGFRYLNRLEEPTALLSAPLNKTTALP